MTEPQARVIVKYTDGSAEVRWITPPAGKVIANISTVCYWELEP